MKIDADLLTQAINEHKDAQFQKDFREWLVYTAPPEVQAIFKSYAEKKEAKDEEARRGFQHERLLVIAMMALVAGVIIYQMMSSFPGCQ